MAFKRKLHQPLALVRETWVELQLKKQQQPKPQGEEGGSAPTPTPTPRHVLESMFFTWRGDKVYPSATLETLGIQPPSAADSWLSRSGSRYQRPEQGDTSSGYWGRDKVHFEAWTQPLYEEYLQRRERERLRARGELSDDDEGGDGADGAAGAGEEQEQQQEKEKHVKVILKARDMDNEHVRAWPSTTIATLAVAFKRLKKLPADTVVELHWDGEVLAPDSTVEDAEIEDLDSLEVHIK